MLTLRFSRSNSLEGGDSYVNLESLARYLDSCPLAVAFTESGDCVLGCGMVLVGNSSIRTDGQWAWRADLAHYVSVHRVPLDERFLLRGEERGWVPISLEELPGETSNQIEEVLSSGVLNSPCE